jgi:parvulin-like peptidyl-prolyl isomerase
MLIDKKEPRIPDFEEVKAKVAEAVKRERAKEQLAQIARDTAASVKGPGDIKAAAEKFGFEVATEEGYKLGGTIGKVGTSPALDEAIYSLKTGEVTKTPLKVGDNWIVLGVTNRIEADLADFAQQRAQLMQTMLSAKQNQVFEDYIATVQRRMTQEGKIKIYQDVLASIDESEPEIALPPGAQFPGSQ